LVKAAFLDLAELLQSLFLAVRPRVVQLLAAESLLHRAGALLAAAARPAAAQPAAERSSLLPEPEAMPVLLRSRRARVEVRASLAAVSNRAMRLSRAGDRSAFLRSGFRCCGAEPANRAIAQPTNVARRRDGLGLAI
jgi:hypothetical protein